MDTAKLTYVEVKQNTGKARLIEFEHTPGEHWIPEVSIRSINPNIKRIEITTSQLIMKKIPFKL